MKLYAWAIDQDSKTAACFDIGSCNIQCDMPEAKLNQTLRLSVLDQSPISANSTPAQALQNSIELARHVEALGYRRFWMSEHHAMDTLACTAPEVMLARIGAETSHIRIGSGGIMLPHYSPLKVAEAFRMLHALYPGRVDLGIGRAPGGGPVEALALRRDRKTPAADDFTEQLSELLAFLDQDFPRGHPFGSIRVSPAMPGSPDVWLLGSSMWSAATAAEFSLPYAFAHFFSPEPTRAAIEMYRRSFTAGKHRSQPEPMVAVGALCAETKEEAEYLHASVRLLQRRIRQGSREPIASPDDALRELQQPSGLPFREGRFRPVGVAAILRWHSRERQGTTGADGKRAGDRGACDCYDHLQPCGKIAVVPAHGRCFWPTLGGARDSTSASTRELNASHRGPSRPYSPGALRGCEI